MKKFLSKHKKWIALIIAAIVVGVGGYFIINGILTAPPIVVNPDVTNTPIPTRKPVEEQLEEGNKEEGKTQPTAGLEEEPSPSLVPTPGDIEDDAPSPTATATPVPSEATPIPSQTELPSPTEEPKPTLTPEPEDPLTSYNPIPTPILFDEVIGDRCKLSVSVSPKEGGTIEIWGLNKRESEQTAIFNFKARAEVFADALPGWEFDHWELDGIPWHSTDDYLTLVMDDGHKNFTAVFKKIGAAPTPTPMPNIIKQYKLGDNITGTLYDNMHYVLTGTGATYDYSFNQPHNKSGEMLEYKLKVQKVVVGEGITEIGEMALAWFHNCKEIVLPSTLTKIGKEAFAGCGELGFWSWEGGPGDYVNAVPWQDQWFMKINLEDTKVKEIGIRAFRGCTFEKIVFPKTLEVMRDDCFKLTRPAVNEDGFPDDIVIPASVRQVGHGCFSNQYRIIIKGKSSMDEFELVTDWTPEQVVAVGGYRPFHCVHLVFEP